MFLVRCLYPSHFSSTIRPRGWLFPKLKLLLLNREFLPRRLLAFFISSSCLASWVLDWITASSSESSSLSIAAKLSAESIEESSESEPSLRDSQSQVELAVVEQWLATLPRHELSSFWFLIRRRCCSTRRATRKAGGRDGSISPWFWEFELPMVMAEDEYRLLRALLRLLLELMEWQEFLSRPPLPREDPRIVRCRPGRRPRALPRLLRELPVLLIETVLEELWVESMDMSESEFLLLRLLAKRLRTREPTRFPRGPSSPKPTLREVRMLLLPPKPLGMGAFVRVVRILLVLRTLPSPWLLSTVMGTSAFLLRYLSRSFQPTSERLSDVDRGGLEYRLMFIVIWFFLRGRI